MLLFFLGHVSIEVEKSSSLNQLFLRVPLVTNKQKLRTYHELFACITFKIVLHASNLHDLLFPNSQQIINYALQNQKMYDCLICILCHYIEIYQDKDYQLPQKFIRTGIVCYTEFYQERKKLDKDAPPTKIYQDRNPPTKLCQNRNQLGQGFSSNRNLLGQAIFFHY